MDNLNFINLPSTGLGVGTAVIIVLALWEIFWKGTGMWHAARDGQSGWFIAILVFNTLGILPILYVYVFSKKQQKTS